MAALAMTQRPLLPIAPFSGLALAAQFGASGVAFIASKLRPGWKTAANWLVRCLMGVILVLYFAAMNHPFWGKLPPRLQELSLLLDLMGITFAMLAGYNLFLIFINSEGVTHIRAQIELDIAYRMQSTLVPPVSLRTPYVMYGRSRPSERVGGDLVDAAECGGATLAYIADISGHGLNAGILMGMCKTAIRTALLVEREMSSLINAVNRVLPAVKESNMYATLGGLRFEGDGRVEYAVAGHPPNLHYLANTAETSRLSMEQFPVGMFPSAQFSTQTEACGPGDLFAIATDGILEVSNAAGVEFGLERLAKILKDNADKPLQAIFELVLAQADAFGKQDDDQTLLLVRVRA